MDLQPQIQLSDTDGTGPVKRRRPALSCVECRRRKVKCDREKPCGPCTKVQSSTCTYRPNPHSVGRQSKSPVTVSTGLNRSSPHTPAQASDFDSMLNRYIAPGILGPHGSVMQSHLPTLTPDASGSDSAATVKSLLRKVQQLEERLDSMKEAEVSSHPSLPLRDSASATPGQFVKSKFFGGSHWVNAIEPYEALGNTWTIRNPNNNRVEVNRSSDLYAAVVECKKMARTIKAARAVHHPTIPPEVHSSIPSKAVCDQLVQAYLRTFEGVFRVLHIPTFLEEYDQYWANPTAAKPSLVTKLLLVCAIGVSFYDGEDRARLRPACVKWISAAEYWLSAPHEKSRLNLTGIQIHILLLLAREMCSVDGDLIWIPAGALLRSAMHCGLHRDPSQFPKISPFHAEMRRRLWTTVLEITVQSSLDMGMPPMISLQDFDTSPPANINDEDISESEIEPPQPKPLGHFTQTSVQIAFRQSLPLRLEITRLINSLRSELSYDDTIRIGSELTTICRSQENAFQGSQASSARASAFQVKFHDTLVRRFILSLHRPFYMKAMRDPKYYYSRKICLDLSLAFIAPASQLELGQEDDWTKLITNGVGFVKSVFLYSMTTVYLELLSILREQRQDIPIPGIPTIQTSTSSSSPSSSHRQPLHLTPQFESLYKVISSAKSVSTSRIKNGETNAKGSVFIDCTLARIDAIVSGSDPDQAVLEAARKSIAESAALQRQAYKEEWGVDLESGLHSQFDIAHGGVDAPPAGEMGSADTGITGEPGLEDMDWETLMRDDTIDFGFGFESSPENWLFGGGEGGIGTGI